MSALSELGAAKLISLSETENRTVTEYPSTPEEETALLDALRVSDGYSDECDESGSGYGGDESRGFVDVWGDTWRVSVVHAEVAS